MRRALAALAWLVPLTTLAPAARAGLIAPPPALVAMWDGKDGASVRVALLGYAAMGEQPGASARQKLESGEAAWWLGVQDDRAGRADSALVQWRRAVAMRGDFDEGFAVIDALSGRRGIPPGLDEAYGLASSLADQARMDNTSRLAEAQGRLAWVRYLQHHPDSALGGVREWSDVLRKRPAWTRRLARIELEAGDAEQAWKSLTLLSARTRGRDPSVESLLGITRNQLAKGGEAGYTEARQRSDVSALRLAVEDSERRFIAGLHARPDSLEESEPAHFTVRWLRVPAAKPPAGSRTLAPMLFVLAPDDSLAAADSLAGAFAAAGRVVALLTPRGSYGAVGPGAYGPEDWAGRHAEFLETVTDDAARVMDSLARHRTVPDGAGWVVGAAGDCAPVALAIARRRHDVRALVLVAPKLPVVEVAETRARLRALGTRTFVQTAPEEPTAIELGDLLSRQTAPGQVRVADSGDRGRGVAIFRVDPKIAKRLLDWLAEPAAKKN